MPFKNAGWVELTRADMLAEGRAMIISAGTCRVLLVRDAGSIHAVSATCSHADADLDCGIVRNGWITCPAHGARFDLATGVPLNPPATHPIHVYPVRVRAGTVEVLLESAADKCRD